MNIHQVRVSEVSRPTINRKAIPIIGIVVAFLLSGCVTNQYPYAEVGRSTDLIVGIGYAVIDAQPGSSPEQKRLMAIKASKLEAYKSIAEQLYGQYIESRGRLSNSTLEQEELVSRVEGLVLGARLVSIKPISEDSYETKLEVGRSDLFERLDKTQEDMGVESTLDTFPSLTAASTIQAPKIGSRR